ncbi:hypothetical protein D9758_002295 [Tetrapyrgos nigripes]|uniref:NACHT domain-containing protein n=1 Tax=Tetrapyrgos nigripes TaxID=182062 RepID=A0A8H5GPC8_9AGAR|nr:hypothetical protein D9758_002295 [Tetrapyrgos nigripes]
MGKTSVALAVMHHQSVRDRFTDPCRFWVPCAKAESVPLLLGILYHSLCITRKSGDSLEDILSELELPSGQLHLQPHRILLLDNFETPWNLCDQEEIERILCTLEKIPRVSLFITMRANQPPTNQRWDTVHIQPLDLDASVKIYTEIHAKAIKLLANYAKTNGATPLELLDAWEWEGTAMLTLDSNSVTNALERSIKLSIESPRMRNSPDALELLILLALLQPLFQLRIYRTRGRLRACHSRDTFISASFQSHSPANSPRLSKSCPPSVLLTSISTQFFPGGPSYQPDKRLILSEEDNLQSILLSATADPDADVSPEILEALLILSLHHRWTRPRLNLIEHTLSVSQRIKNDEYIAKSLACYAEMCRGLSLYQDAVEKASQAREKFIALQDYSSAV